MKIRIGTRSSQLALWQAEHVAELLRTAYPNCTVELVTMSTKGDRILEKPLAEIGGKGLFTEELERAMLAGEIDLAVHSLKDMPTELAEGLTLAAFTKREDARDVLVSKKYASLVELPQGAIVGTSSLRRQAQLWRLRPDLDIRPLRGNVNTRLQKLEAGEYDAIVLAYAGLTRLGFDAYITEALSTEVMLPAVGQGALALECVAGSPMEEMLQQLEDSDTRYAVLAERAFLRTCEGGCQVPIAVYATVQSGVVTMEGRIGSLRGDRWFIGQRSMPVAEAEKGGKALAEQLLAEGAEGIIEDLKREGIL